MQAKLAEFDRNKVWRLIPKLENVLVVGLKWVFKNKADKEGNVFCNKERPSIKGIVSNKVFIMIKNLLMSQDSKKLEFFLPM